MLLLLFFFCSFLYLFSPVQSANFVWQLNGFTQAGNPPFVPTEPSENFLQLTSLGSIESSGSAFVQQPFLLTKDFGIQFSFVILANPNSPTNSPCEGFGVVVQNDPNQSRALGACGAGFGMGTSNWCGGSMQINNAVGLVMTACPWPGFINGFSFYKAGFPIEPANFSPMPNMKLTASVTYSVELYYSFSSGSWKFFINDNKGGVFEGESTADYGLGHISSPQETYYVGFSGATGGGSSQVNVFNISYSFN